MELIRCEEMQKILLPDSCWDLDFTCSVLFAFNQYFPLTFENISSSHELLTSIVYGTQWANKPEDKQKKKMNLLNTRKSILCMYGICMNSYLNKLHNNLHCNILII